MGDASARLVRANLVSVTEQRLHCLFEIGGCEAEGTCCGFIDDAALRIDQNEAIRPAGVSGFGFVVDAVKQRRDVDAEIANARRGGGVAVGIGFGGGEENAILDVGVQLPQVGRVGFLDIDDVEADAIAIGVVELV